MRDENFYRSTELLFALARYGIVDVRDIRDLTRVQIDTLAKTITATVRDMKRANLLSVLWNPIDDTSRLFSLGGMAINEKILVHRSIVELGFKQPTIRALLTSDIDTIGRLLTLEGVDAIKRHAFGKKHKAEVEEVLARHGLRFPEVNDDNAAYITIPGQDRLIRVRAELAALFTPSIESYLGYLGVKLSARSLASNAFKTCST